MKIVVKMAIYLSFFALITGFLVSCNNSLNSNSGSIKLTIVWSNQLSVKKIPERTETIIITITGKDISESKPVKKTITRDSNQQITRLTFVLPTGDKKVKVEAFDKEGLLLATAQNTTIVYAQLTSRVEIELKEASSLPVIVATTPSPTLNSSSPVKPEDFEIYPGDNITIAKDSPIQFAIQNYELKITNYELSDNTMGTIDENGVFTPKNSGATELKIIKKVVKINITNGNLVSIKPSIEETLTIVKGFDIPIKASGTDSLNNTVTVTPAWSVDNENIGIIDKTGHFIAKNAGTTTIRGIVVGNAYMRSFQINIEASVVE